MRRVSRAFVLAMLCVWCMSPGMAMAAARAAAEWRFFHTSGDNSISYYYDAESVVFPSANIVNVWVKLEVRSKVYSLALWEISCSERKLRTLIKYGYDGVGGGVVELPNAAEMYPTRWGYIVPESYEAKLTKIVCVRQKGN